MRTLLAALIGEGGSSLSDEKVELMVRDALARLPLSGKRVLILVPDHTRTAPIPLFFRVLCEELAGRAARLDFMVALGTHPPLDAAAIRRLIGGEPPAGVHVFNHHWDRPGEMALLSSISETEIEELTGGRFREEVPVSINRRILDYDHLLVLGPTFPHEVVGFSGGNKYFFPGISGPEILNFFHWLGAVITNLKIIGVKRTAVRAVVDRAASLIPVPRTCFSLVVAHEGLKGLFVGSPEAAFDAAADLSAKIHIVEKDRLFQSVLSISPPMYDDLWVAAKCMYKLEPVVADGGEIIVLAPHVCEVSRVHGEHLERIGYHCCEYFLKQMERFEGVPRGVLAHSTHLRGVGTLDGGVERPRIRVTLATGIPEECCRRIGLGYRDPATVRPENWEGREAEGILLVRNAGETLYRLRASVAGPSGS